MSATTTTSTSPAGELARDLVSLLGSRRSAVLHFLAPTSGIALALGGASAPTPLQVLQLLIGLAGVVGTYWSPPHWAKSVVPFLTALAVALPPYLLGGWHALDWHTLAAPSAHALWGVLVALLPNRTALLPAATAADGTPVVTSLPATTDSAMTSAADGYGASPLPAPAPSPVAAVAGDAIGVTGVLRIVDQAVRSAVAASLPAPRAASPAETRAPALAAVAAGTHELAGEAGPELFTPTTASAVLPAPSATVTPDPASPVPGTPVTLPADPEPGEQLPPAPGSDPADPIPAPPATSPAPAPAGPTEAPVSDPEPHPAPEPELEPQAAPSAPASAPQEGEQPAAAPDAAEVDQDAQVQPDPRVSQTDNSGEADQPLLDQSPDYRPDETGVMVAL